MTRSSQPRIVCRRRHHYRPKKVNIKELLPKSKPVEISPRVIYVQSPYYEQMERGEKTVEARPYYPMFHDILPGSYVEFSNRFSGNSFIARITTKRIFRDFATMLRKESIQSCLPDHDPEDLQRAVNTYHSFRNETYRYIAKKHKVMSLRFTHVDDEPPKSPPKKHRTDLGRIKKAKSLCAIFDPFNPRVGVKRRNYSL